MSNFRCETSRLRECVAASAVCLSRSLRPLTGAGRGWGGWACTARTRLMVGFRSRVCRGIFLYSYLSYSTLRLCLVAVVSSNQQTSCIPIHPGSSCFLVRIVFVLVSCLYCVFLSQALRGSGKHPWGWVAQPTVSKSQQKHTASSDLPQRDPSG